MRICTSFRWLLALLLVVGSLSAAQASHIRGGDITYATVTSTTAGVPRYHVVVRNFVELNSPVTSTSIDLNASRGSCSMATPLVIAIPRTQLFNSNLQTCGVAGPFYQIAVYEADIDLPLPLGQWVLSATAN